MVSKRGARNVYDPRVRELVHATGNPDLLPELGCAACGSVPPLERRPYSSVDSSSRLDSSTPDRTNGGATNGAREKALGFRLRCFFARPVGFEPTTYGFEVRAAGVQW